VHCICKRQDIRVLDFDYFMCILHIYLCIQFCIVILISLCHVEIIICGCWWYRDIIQKWMKSISTPDLILNLASQIDPISLNWNRSKNRVEICKSFKNEMNTKVILIKLSNQAENLFPIFIANNKSNNKKSFIHPFTPFM
jgi:hypothetical protein